jgi:hypothetical protein
MIAGSRLEIDACAPRLVQRICGCIDHTGQQLDAVELA